ncbi:hypothetical protein WJX73_008472 [Symbiochloris irregularis]|uniref:Large ribosomal subunit protein bL21m n=1 Tax=Symbiochloris irregularis TaxID=706552 RepID=A0AAW1PNY8_9CHLO
MESRLGLLRSDFAGQAIQSARQACRSIYSDAEDDLPRQYSKAGRVDGPYTLKRTPVFAVVEIGPTQYKVSADDLVYAEKLKGVTVNDKVTLNRVLMLGSRYETVIGRPIVPEAFVSAAVEEQILDGKVLVFHKRRRKNSKKMKGHRQELTGLRILEVHGIESEQATPAEEAIAA